MADEDINPVVLLADPKVNHRVSVSYTHLTLPTTERV